MTSVERSHGGDGGGDDRDPPAGHLQPPTQCQSTKKVRGPSTGKELKKRFKANGKQRLQIKFDIGYQGTGRAVGNNTGPFVNLVGSTVGETVPLRYNSWKRVPAEDKSAIWPEIKAYFNMKPHLRGPHAKLVKDGVEALCAERYRNRKSTFKSTWFIHRGGYDDPVQIRSMLPPNMSAAEWNKYCDYYQNVKTKKLAKVNAENREKQIIPSLHGTRSYAAHRHKDLEDDGEYPGLVESYGKMHKKKGKGAWAHTEAKTRHKDMVDLRDSETVTMDEHAILGKVLGMRSGYNPGRGRKLPGHASTSTSEVPQQRMYTQEQVDSKMGKVVTYANNQFDAFYSAFESANIRVPSYKKLEAQGFEDDEDDDEEEDEE